MLQYLAEVLVKRHAAIAGSLFAASAIGSFMYTVNYGSSAFVDAHTLIAGDDKEECAQRKVTYNYTMKFRS